MDAVAFSIRPTTSGPMASSQICLTLGDCQIDNQMYAKGSYDFPVILKGHEVTNVKKLLPQVWQYGLWSFQTGDTKLERFIA